MSVDAGDALLRALHEHNPWWTQGADAFSLPPRAKSDFYHLARPDRAGSQFEDQAVLGLVGRRGVGKTTLLEAFVHHRIEAGDAPERFLYLPMDADPLYQLRSDDQLRAAVRHYESRVLGRAEVDGPEFVLLDDVHRVEHPSKSGIEGWGGPVADLLADPADRHVVVTAVAGVQVDRELDRAGVEDGRWDTQPILPEKFRDYVFGVHPELETDQYRVSPSSLRAGERSLPACIERASAEPFAAELRSKYERVAGRARRIGAQVVDYLAMGGTISYDRDGVVTAASELTAADYERLRTDVRTTLYQEVPGLESIRTIADLERLCALAARIRGREPVRYQELVELFDVDRRTIAGSYLPTLAQLYLLNGVTEYDNQRPRSVQLYLRDTGLVTALAEGDPGAVRRDVRREADLARVAAFDHTKRFAYGVAAAQGEDRDPAVQFWRGGGGTVEYVFEVGGTPVPVALAYRESDRAASLDALRAFRETFEAPVGLLLSGDTTRTSDPVLIPEEGIVGLPYWLYLLIC